MNKSEEIVYKVCKKSFLSLWSYANPIIEDNKELCDILVVCDPDIIIFSVKEIEYKLEKGDSTGWDRWIRKAIEKSSNQIYGAERWLATAENVIRCDGQLGISIPSRDKCKIHRIAVAFGGQDKVPLVYGDFGKGFVHVFDETSFDILLSELNTVVDFVGYLITKESMLASGITLISSGAEEDLLAFYLHNSKKLPSGNETIAIDHTLWKAFIEKEEYKKKREEDRASYCWDAIIEKIAEDALGGNLEFGSSLNEAEIALRIMAREDRFCRRIIGKAFSEFYFFGANKIRSRWFVSPSSIVYVFLARPHGTDRNLRKAELGLRCFVARGINSACRTVVGIATEEYKKGKGYSFDLYLLDLPIWEKKHQKHCDDIQKSFGYFRASYKREGSEDEYPRG